MNYSEHEYISWGAGVNSTAIIALYLLGSIEPKPEIVFADTGVELPETYEYIEKVTDALHGRGWNVTIISSSTHPEIYEAKGRGKTLYDYLWENQTLPSIKWRACTSRYKQRPLRVYAAGRVALIGICADEFHRAKLGSRKFSYPILHFTREQCRGLIVEAGLPEAHKTGCYFCPLQPKNQWIRLYNEHRELFDLAVELEEHSIRWRYLNGMKIKDKMRGWIAEEEFNARQLDLPGIGII